MPHGFGWTFSGKWRSSTWRFAPQLARIAAAAAPLMAIRLGTQLHRLRIPAWELLQGAGTRSGKLELFNGEQTSRPPTTSVRIQRTPPGSAPAHRDRRPESVPRDQVALWHLFGKAIVAHLRAWYVSQIWT